MFLVKKKSQRIFWPSAIRGEKKKQSVLQNSSKYFKQSETEETFPGLVFLTFISGHWIGIQIDD